MKEHILSLDIFSGKAESLDISGFFPISQTKIIGNPFQKRTIDEVFFDLDEIDLSESSKLELSRFETMETLDMGIEEIMNFPKYVSGNHFALRPRLIDINPELDNVPYGSLDVRMEQVIPRKRKYSDLFRRPLPKSLALRRSYQQTRHYISQKKRPILVGLATFCAIILPSIFYVKYSVEHGYNTLISLKNASNLQEIREKVQIAKGDFDRANFLFLPFSWIPNENIDLARSATRGGQSLTRAFGQVLASIPNGSGSLVPNIVVSSEDSAYRAPLKDIFPLDNLGIPVPTEWLTKNRDVVAHAIADIQDAGKIYAGVEGDSHTADLMRQVGELVSDAGNLLGGYQAHQDDIMRMLGATDPARYIVFNQNNDEIRANGGFPGSIITFTLYKGNILDYRADDVYYFDWNLYPYKETPPPGIALLTENYGLRDVNYYPDFRETLEKANAFVEKSGDPTLTTAIAINQGLIEGILKVTGPVTLSGVSIPFESDNFSLLMSLLVENKFSKELSPKDILFDFVGAFSHAVLESKKYQQIAETVRDSWDRGEILLASRDDQVEKFLKQITKPLPWECTVNCEKNWIYPIFTSVSGNKSDRYIDRTIQVETKKIDQCLYENSVHLTLTHTYAEKDRTLLTSYMDTIGITDAAEREKLRFIQGDGTNRNFIRFFLPKGSEAIGSGLTLESNETDPNTVYSFMLDTSVGGKSSKLFRYRLNIPNCSDYDGSVEVTRQPGLKNLFVQ